MRFYRDGDFVQIRALSNEGFPAYWSTLRDSWSAEDGRWDSCTVNSYGASAFQSGTTVEYYDGGEAKFKEDILAFDIGETTTVRTWIDTEGCFHADGSGLNQVDCDGPFQPVVVGGTAGNYALAEDGTVHQLDTLDDYYNRFFCGPPEGEFKTLERGGNLTCGIRTSGSLVCWAPGNSGLAEWLRPASERYEVAEGTGTDCQLRRITLER